MKKSKVNNEIDEKLSNEIAIFNKRCESEYIYFAILERFKSEVQLRECICLNNVKEDDISVIYKRFMIRRRYVNNNAKFVSFSFNKDDIDLFSDEFNEDKLNLDKVELFIQKKELKYFEM